MLPGPVDAETSTPSCPGVRPHMFRNRPLPQQRPHRKSALALQTHENCFATTYFDGSIIAPERGSGAWHLDRCTAVGVATGEPHGATRWRFA
jgi:hypothetical protein